MVSSNDGIFGVLPSRITVGSGATIAYFMDVCSGERSLTLKYLSGGTLEILEATVQAVYNASYSVQGITIVGTTLPASQLAAINGTGYLMGTTEILTFSGSPRMYLSATGATTFLTAIIGKGQGS